MEPQTIDQVLGELDSIIIRARKERSRFGFFAALYRNVTIKVKEGVATGLFEDGPRMEELDVKFANRYLAALERFRRGEGERLSKCWQVSFQAAERWSPIILQHLLTGSNAHINFDLAIAAQAIAPGAELPTLKNDFAQINNILSEMISKVRSQIEEVSPWIRLLDRYSSQAEDRFINFSYDKAQASAWLVANIINTTPAEQLPRKLMILDDGVAMLGSLISNPKEWLIGLGLRVIRLRESNDIPHILDVLSQM